MKREQGEKVEKPPLSSNRVWRQLLVANFRIASTVKQHKMPQNDSCMQTTTLSVTIDFKQQYAELEKTSWMLKTSMHQQ